MFESLILISGYLLLATIQWFLLFIICKTNKLTGLSNGKSCAKWASAEFGAFVRHIVGLLSIRATINKYKKESEESQHGDGS